MTKNQLIPNLSVKFPKILIEQEVDDVKALEALCLERGHVSLKLELDFKLSLAQATPQDKGELNDFLYYDGGKLISYLGICAFEGGAELNGMTHPDYRGRGAFGRLHALAMGECGRRGYKCVLLLCDRNSRDGLRFIRRAGGVLHHSELEMALKSGAPVCMSDHSVKLCGEWDSAGGTFLAYAEGEPVGRVRLEFLDGRGGVYGFAVQPEFRGRGYGTGILLRAVEKLREMGAESIRLQVDESNGPARHIYEKAGFEPVCVMDYYQLEI